MYDVSNNIEINKLSKFFHRRNVRTACSYRTTSLLVCKIKYADELYLCRRFEA